MTRDTFEQTLTTEYAANPSLKMHVMPLTEDLVVNATMKGSLCRSVVRISLLANLPSFVGTLVTLK